MRSSDGTGHRLREVNQIVRPHNLDELIQERIDSNRITREKTRVMEIGGGNGLAIMELKKKFPEVEFYIINRQKNHSIYRRESIGGAALQAKIFTVKELKTLELPYLIFRNLDNGGFIPYDNNKFDIVYSFNTLDKITYKYELISETLRILKTGGLSLHITNKNFNIYKGGIKLDEFSAESALKKLGLDINSSEQFFIIRKNDVKLPLPLRPHIPISNGRNDFNELNITEMGYHLE